ncbi:diaminopimelate epimerase [Peptococcaceae bacterium SCADC1_2_3]|nr:diaminopimelate epimerase [Peptococcaceae bacterium SCADC1_2_3]
MKFVKMHGLGNDFVLIDFVGSGLEQVGLIETKDLKAMAQRICLRHFGIGADGLVILLPGEKARVRMRIFNPDGSEAEMCGNAIRCVAAYLYRHGLLEQDETREIKVETLAGIMIPKLIITKEGEVKAVQVDMGEPRLERAEIPMLGPSGPVINEPLKVGSVTVKVTAVSMGNPHCLVFVDFEHRTSNIELRIGPQLENHPVFPQRTNVEFIQVLNRSNIKVRVWERGAGATLACGTGACAALVGCVLNNFTDRQVTVHLPGGDLNVSWREDNHVYLTGPAEKVFTGEF